METTMDCVIFGTSNSREEVQSLKGQGLREVTRKQRELWEQGHLAGAVSVLTSDPTEIIPEQ